MNRLHIHMKVENIDASVEFYSALFGRAPDKLEADYAKWLLDDPAANIAISSHGEGLGIDHVGIQVADDAALEEIARRIEAKAKAIMPEADATCCYARSNKYWAQSPEGAKWELFHTFGESAVYGAEPAKKAATYPARGCC